MQPQPKVCNIDKTQILFRFWMGVIFAVISLALGFYLYSSNQNILFISPFIFASTVSFLQAKRKYCVYFGIIDLIKNPKEHMPEISQIIELILTSALLTFVIMFFVSYGLSARY